MQTEPELVALPHPEAAANEDFLPRRHGAAFPGWNAYDVWRVRIKAVLDSRVSSRLLAHDVYGPEPGNSQ